MSLPDFQERFEAALAYDAYVKTGTEEQQRRWKQVYDAARLTSEQSTLVRNFARDMHILVISGIWCGDCVQQCPLIERIAETNSSKIHTRYIDRDQQKDFSQQFRVNAGDRVPVVIFLSEDFEFCGSFGDRTINRYRALARKQLGPSCPIGLAPPDPDEVAATLKDWLCEIERIQLMLRLSPRLRQKHGD